MTKAEIHQIIKTSKAPVEISWERGEVRFVKIVFDGPMNDTEFDNLLDEIMVGNLHGFMKITQDPQHGYNIVTWERRMQKREESITRKKQRSK
jgi:hypothetical protein